MTGSMIIKGRGGNVGLRMTEQAVSADLPAGATPESYTVAHFEQDLDFALTNARSGRSPIEHEINFLKEFKRRYEIAKAETSKDQKSLSEEGLSQDPKAEEAVRGVHPEEKFATIKDALAMDEEKTTQESLKQDGPSDGSQKTAQEKVAAVLDEHRRKSEEKVNDTQPPPNIPTEEPTAADLSDIAAAHQSAIEAEKEKNQNSASATDTNSKEL